jgi:PAS domain S-box-containing protein
MSMRHPLRILSIEDDPKDTELIQNLLETEDIVCEVTRVDTQAALLVSLEQGRIDLILADYSLPSFDGISALKLAMKACPDVPFIFVSGTLGEEVAIEALKIGATDYVLKTRLSRLVPSVVRALREARERAERKQADENLRRSEAYLTEAQRLSHTGSFGCTPSTGEMFWSEETFRIYGYDQTTKPTVEHVLQRVHPEDKPLVQEHMDRASRDGKACDIECRLLLPDDSVKHVRIVAHASKNESGIIRFIGAVMDVTATKQAEEKLRRSEAYLAEAQKLSQTGSFGWSVLNGEIYWSEETFHIFEQDRAVKPTMESIFQRIHPDDRDRVQQTLDHAINEKTDFDIEHRLLMPDGSVKHLHAIARASKTSSGKLEYVGAVTDVTTTKRTEQTLREREAYLAESQRLAHTGSWALDGTTREARYWSEEMFRIFGFDPRQGFPKRDQWLQRMHPEDRDKVKRQASDRMFLEKADSDIEYRIVLPDGTVKHIHGLAHPALSPNKELVEVVGTVVDITERKTTEEALRRSESYLAQAQKLAHIGSWVWEVAGRSALYLSDEWYRIYGFDPNDGMPTWKERLQQIHPEDRARWQSAIDQAIADKSDYDVEFRILSPRSTVRYIHSVGHPILSPSGELLQFLGVAMDVTERECAEEERERLRQALAELAHINRVSMMGELTASLAHEIKQPIFAASADAETCVRWLARERPNLAEAQEAALRLMKDVSRASDIINRIVSLFKKEAPQRGLVDLNGVVQEMITLLRSEASRYSISIDAELAEGLPQVMADRVALQQVLMNLMLNAIEAMKGTGTPGNLTIATRQDENRQILISVTDTGVGLPSGQAEQIFTAFFSSKPQGTGMGLPISRSIIESHGGRLWATSNPGRGATFQFALPLEAAARQSA